MPDIYRILRNLLAPTNPKDKPFVDIVATLREHYELKPLIITERLHFRQRNQASGESIAGYMAKLWWLASKCDFGAYYIYQYLEEAYVSETMKEQS